MNMPQTQTQSERQFQSAVMQFARHTGWTVAHFNDSRREVVRQDGSRHVIGDKDAAGFPDLLLVRERAVYAELKSAKGKLSPAQLRWIGALSEAGQEVYVWKPVAWTEIEAVLR